MVPGGRAHPVLGAVRPPEEEVQVVLPRVADAAVDLDAVLGRPRRRARRPRPWRRARRGGGRRRRRRSSSPRTAPLPPPARRRASTRRACAGSPGTTRSARRTGSAPSRTPSVMSNRRRAVPTISAASPTVATRRARASSTSADRRVCPTPGARDLEHVGARSRSSATTPQLGVGRRDDAHRRPRVDDDDPVDTVGLGHERLHRVGVRRPRSPSSPATASEAVASPASTASRRSSRAAARTGAASATVGKKRPGAAT